MTDIHDMIQQAPLECSEKAVSALFDIVTALNDRILVLNSALGNVEDRLERMDKERVKSEDHFSERIQQLEAMELELP